uniref:EXS domain-containing protein n=1 Tax=Ascaris lumbricoides TaxID=6252 RepID=A0A0M3I4Z7_ASCLU
MLENGKTHVELQMSVIMNIFAQGADSKGWRKYAIGYAALVLAFFMRDWFRLHGQKLSRHLKPLINISQLVANWNFFPWFEIFAPDKETAAGKYLFNAEGPILNEDIPRTPNKSPPKSPPKTADIASVKNPRTQKGM